MKRMISFIATLVLLYVLLVAGMAAFQRKLMYLPDTVIATPAHYGLEGFQDLCITSADGVTLQLWYRPAKAGFPMIAYFHGNASHIGGRAGIFSALAEKGFGVVALSYRGYGKSEGSPSEAGLYDDARATIGFLTGELHIALNRIMLYGESLGTGVAVQMATEYNVAGLLLQAPYTSVAARAAEIYYFLPVQLVIRDRFDSIHKIGKVKAPLLLFHGALDATIPIAHGKALFAAATAPKNAFYFPQYAHNDFDTGMLAEHVLDFAETYHLVTP